MSANCLVCGLPLTEHTSVAEGIGPVCREKAIMSENFDEVIKHLPGQHTQQSHGRKGSGGGEGGAPTGGSDYATGTKISFYRKGGRKQGEVVGKRGDGRLDVKGADGKKFIVDPNRKRTKVKIEGEGTQGKKKPSQVGLQKEQAAFDKQQEIKRKLEQVMGEEKKPTTKSKKVTSESIANGTGNFTPNERKFMVRELIGSKQAKQEYDQEYASRWSKRGGHAGAKQISQKLDKAEAMGFKQVELKQGHSPDGSYIGSGEYYEHPRGATITTYRNYGVMASENSFDFSLEWKQDSEGN